MSSSEMRIGIMGGTFNPIHYGHLIAAESAWQEFRLNKVIFVPTFHPPHKPEPEVSPQHRYQMTKLAIESNKHFTISEIELNRPGKSYSEETLRQFKEIYGPEAELYFIIGSDAIAELDTWKNIEKLLGLCQFIAVSRPGYKLPIGLSYAHPLEIPGIAISAEEIRERIKTGRSIKYLVTERVEQYIYEHQLYRRSDKSDLSE